MANAVSDTFNGSRPFSSRSLLHSSIMSRALSRLSRLVASSFAPMCVYSRYLDTLESVRYLYACSALSVWNQPAEPCASFSAASSAAFFASAAALTAASYAA